ncbi:MAG: RIP metalloprotease RseP, partial [Rhodocyclales bacterium CG17_big_fil_post_rev_8_21_14_2_50_68_7]
VGYFDDISAILSELPPDGGAVSVLYERDGRRLDASLAPTWEAAQSGPGGRWMLGIQARRAEAPHDAILRHGPIDAVGAALRETWRLT